MHCSRPQVRRTSRRHLVQHPPSRLQVVKAPERDSDIPERGEHGVGAQSLDLARERVKIAKTSLRPAAATISRSSAASA